MFPLKENLTKLEAIPSTGSKPVKVIAVSSGKGGVGKTNVSINLAIALIGLGRRVVLFDADMGLANVDVLLGIKSLHNLEEVIKGTKKIEDIMISIPCGLKIIPATSGVRKMVNLSPSEHVGLVQAFSEIESRIDIMLIDTAAGINDSVTTFVRAAQETVIVVCNEPASITDAYALIKVLNLDFGLTRFRILANMAHGVQDGREIFMKLTRTTDRFLDVALDFIGVIPYDENVIKSVQRQKAVVEAYPRSKAAMAFKHLAQKADNWPMPSDASGYLQFFVERLITPNNGYGG